MAKNKLQPKDVDAWEADLANQIRQTSEPVSYTQRPWTAEDQAGVETPHQSWFQRNSRPLPVVDPAPSRVRTPTLTLSQWADLRRKEDEQLGTDEDDEIEAMNRREGHDKDDKGDDGTQAEIERQMTGRGPRPTPRYNEKGEQASNPDYWRRRILDRVKAGKTKGGAKGQEEDDAYSKVERLDKKGKHRRATRLTDAFEEARAPGSNNPISEKIRELSSKNLGKGGFSHEHFHEAKLWPGQGNRAERSIKQYNRFFNEHPKALAGLFDHIPGEKALHIASDEPGQLEVESNHKDGGQITRTFKKGENGLEVHHDFFQLPMDKQGAGIAKKFLGASMDFYEKHGVKKVHLHANIDVGGYAWAKYGFVPSETSAKRLGRRLYDNLAGYTVPIPKDVEYQIVRLAQGDGKAIRDLADIEDKLPNGKAWGKQLLLGSDWHGSLDLSDKDTMERFNAYVRK